MADRAKITHESCHYVWQIPTNLNSNLSTEQFGKEHLKWKLEYMADSGHLYLHLLSAPFSTVMVRYSIKLVNSCDLASDESNSCNLNLPLDGIYELIWHDVSQNFASIFSSTISKIFSHRQMVVLNFKEYVSQRNQAGEGIVNLVVNITAECSKEFQQTLNLTNDDDKLNVTPSTLSVYNFQSNRLLNSMLEDSDFADLVIIVGSTKFKVHRSVLGSISPVFRTLLLERMSKNSNEIEINDISEDALKIMITFMYTGVVVIPDYPTCLELLKASDIYGIQNLKASCAEYLLKELTQVNVIEILLNAELYNVFNLKEYALQFFLDNIRKYDPSDFEEIMRIKPSLFPVLCARMTEMHTNQMSALTPKRKGKG